MAHQYRFLQGMFYHLFEFSDFIIPSSCQVHPSGVDFEVSRFRNKMVINVLGEEKRILKAANDEGDYSDYL